MTGLRAITVCVGYEDLLAVTLPYNRHHFDEVHIVTDHASVHSVHAIMRQCPGRENVWYHATDLFTADGAVFNKWRALEWGLDQMGRRGWLCVMDADVLWPKAVQVDVAELGWLRFRHASGRLAVKPGELMSPLRRMAPWPIQAPSPLFSPVLYPEAMWETFPVHRNVAEWAGYTQVFHADDLHLETCATCKTTHHIGDYDASQCDWFVWHDIHWTHAGGADSFFQQLWPASAKVRPSWEVLHLGEAGANWFGRGNPQAAELTRELWRGRAARRSEGLDPFAPEKLK